jgi:hypothetical protein
MTTEIAEPTFSVPEVARRAGSTMGHIYRQVWEQKLVANKDSRGRWMITVSSLDAWLQRRDVVRKLRQCQ